MPVRVQLVLRERKRKDDGKEAKAGAAPAPLQVREAGDAPRGPAPRPRAPSVFMCDRKEPQGRP